MRMVLPEAYEKRMRRMLGDEYAAYCESLAMERQFGLRLNPLKTEGMDPGAFDGFGLRPVPWVRGGYFYAEDVRPAQHPFYAAGLYYLQEPSAMTPASRLPVRPGDRVLDLCAAPGGKATALGAALAGEGLLVANDVNRTRAKALLKNLELFGIANALVTSELPGRLAACFPEYFDCVLVDAPCSGEGMFRKDPEAAKMWDEKRPAYFARIQKDILKNAVAMLKAGGYLMYSTCTFSPEEDEENVAWVLEQFPDMDLLPIEPYEGFDCGRPEWGGGDARLRRAVRIWPQRMEGEGHFLALFGRRDASGRLPGARPGSDRESGRESGERRRDGREGKRRGGMAAPGRQRIDAAAKRAVDGFFGAMGWAPDPDRLEMHGEKLYQVPPLPMEARRLYSLRCGLYLGEAKKNRFEPSQQLAMALRPGDYPAVLSLHPDDERIEKYLRGEPVLVGGAEISGGNGWVLVCVENFSLGWGKLLNGVLKNKYWAGWRRK